MYDICVVESLAVMLGGRSYDPCCFSPEPQPARELTTLPRTVRMVLMAFWAQHDLMAYASDCAPS